jgi:hypothetical protein
MYYLTITQCVESLKQLEIWLQKAESHLTTAHSILRHNGVDLGKLDFMGEIYAKRS